MKKILVGSVIALSALSAAALDFGVQAGRDYAGSNRNFAGLTVGNTMGSLSVTAGFQRTAVTNNDQNRWSLIAGYDLAKVGPVTVTSVVGVAFLDNQSSANGMAVTGGVAASMPITKNVSGVVDYSYQAGQSRVNQFNGGRVTTGLRYKF
jgi:hypothetical protein